MTNTIIVREYIRAAETRVGQGLNITTGTLVTDDNPTQAIPAVQGTPLTATLGASGTHQDIGPLNTSTHFVAIEPTVNVRYCIRPKWDTGKDQFGNSVAFVNNATANHPPAYAGQVTIDSITPGSTLSIYVI